MSVIIFDMLSVLLCFHLFSLHVWCCLDVSSTFYLLIYFSYVLNIVSEVCTLTLLLPLFVKLMIDCNV